EHGGAVHRAHARLRQIVQDAEAGADVHIDGRDVEPEERAGEGERVRGIDHGRYHRGERNVDTDEAQDALRARKPRPRQQPRARDHCKTAAEEVNGAEHGARLVDVESVAAHEESGCPPHEAPAPQRNHATAAIRCSAEGWRSMKRIVSRKGGAARGWLPRSRQPRAGSRIVRSTRAPITIPGMLSARNMTR